MLRLARVGLVAVLLWPATVGAQYPLFDAHIHYNRADWDAYTPERALSILARAGVRRALVSSTPDDGTLKLHERSPAGIVPALRPYRTRDDVAGGKLGTGHISHEAIAALVDENSAFPAHGFADEF